MLSLAADWLQQLCTGVRNITLRLPRTKVPTDETTYECFVFDVSMLGDQPYHLIAFEAYIDNPNVMHHMAAFACDDSGEWCCPVQW